MSYKNLTSSINMSTSATSSGSCQDANRTTYTEDECDKANEDEGEDYVNNDLDNPIA